jgi:hypothetical protein
VATEYIDGQQMKKEAMRNEAGSAGDTAKM